MPRYYKPDPRGKRYKKYDENILEEAVQYYRTNDNMSLKIVAEKFNINKSVLYRHCTRTMKKQGGQTVLSEETEENIIKYINICADWGYPLDSLDLRFLIKNYLEKLGRTVLKFRNNLPGPDFVRSFLKRHKDKISQRNCQNIKKNRAAVSPEAIKEYFKELEVSLVNVEPCNIINYDETNLTDDPGRKKIITKRGTKYPERVMNHSKASISVMMSATADGVLLPPYVVYKAQNLYDTWTEHGPPGTRYNRSQSGWFDANLFEDWVKTIVVPYFKNKEGRKVLIGDNLSSHLSLDVIKLCYKQNISFIFLPANSTHLTQPLDVAFFRPMKIAWRNILLKWKKTDGKTQASVPKGCFPRLLKRLIEDLSDNSKGNIIAGFRKTGIKPIDQNQVLSRLPDEHDANKNEEAIEKSVLDILKEMRYGTINITEPKRKRKLEVISGRSVGCILNEDNIEIDEENFNTSKKTRTGDADENEVNNTSDKKEKKIYKGKGKGKKTQKPNLLLKADVNKKTVCSGICSSTTSITHQSLISKISDENYSRQNIKAKKINNDGEKENFISLFSDEMSEKREIIQVGEDEDSNEKELMHEECPINNISLENLTCQDLETMPILFEDVMQYGDEVFALNEMNYKNTDGLPKKEELQVHIKKENESKKVKIIADEDIKKITKRPKLVQVDLNKCRNISPKLDISKISTRRPSYYKNDADILTDLMDDNVY